MMIDKLKNLIEQSERILITSHVSPDPDALCSILLLGTTLQLNYSDKKVVMTSEELSTNLDFLTGLEKVNNQSFFGALGELEPDLIIIVDAMNLGRVTRDDLQPARLKVAQLSAKIVIIDHHEQVEIEDNQFYINRGSPATVQDIYEILFNELGLQRPEGYAETTLVGLYSDSGGFVHDNPRYKETFALISELVGSGASIEQVKNQLEKYTEPSLWALGELAGNVTHDDDYSYSFASDKFVDKWLADNRTVDEFRIAVGTFTNRFLRNIDGRTWGFVVYKDDRGGVGSYSLSLRALSTSRDVAAIAKQLGGGGHKPAAGAKIAATNVQDAINQIKTAINSL